MGRIDDMNVQPFSCTYLPSSHVNETQIELSYRSMDGDQRQRVASEFGMLMASVAILGSHGGFSGDQFHPCDSNVVVRDTESGSGDFAWSFAHSNVGSELVTTLENLAHGLHFRDRDLNGVKIWTALTAPSRDPKPRLINCYQPFPFEYLYDVMSPTVVVEVEYLERQDAQRMQVCRSVFDAWYAIAAASGFADDEFRPSGEVAILVENELQITSVGMQVVYERAQVGKSGFNVLTNTLTHFHCSIARLESVEIA